MATVTDYNASVGVYLRGMRTLKDLLEKASSHPDAASFPSASLYPDMWPLTRQIQTASDTAKLGIGRLTGKEMESWADDETTMAHLIARVDKTIALLEGLEVTALEGLADRTAVVKTRAAEIKFKGTEYMLAYALPNFFFHVVTAYDILRMKGVDIGKRDFLNQFMGPFVQS